MAKTSPTERPDKLAVLRRRERALHASIADLLKKQQKRDERDYARLIDIAGAASIKYAEGNSDYNLMLRGILKTGVTDPRDTKFLHRMGWL